MVVKIPGALERRHLLDRDLSETQALRIAEVYLEQGRATEALDFLVQADAGDRIKALRRDAVEAGDVFLLRQIGVACEEPPSHDEWLAVAAAASQAGKDRYVAEARRQAERGED